MEKGSPACTSTEYISRSVGTSSCPRVISLGLKGDFYRLIVPTLMSYLGIIANANDRTVI